MRVSALDKSGQAEGELTDEPGVTGEICIAAPHVKDRYDRLWATDRLSSRTRGWHRSGDVGHVDMERRLWVEGRLVNVIVTAYGPVTPVGREQRIEEIVGVRSAAVVGVGPPGTAQVVAVLELDSAARDRVVASPELSARVRSAVDVPVAAVLVTAALPVDIRHASKIDRGRVGSWAERVLAGGRVGQP
jgi:acyl-CoA synthetase (AMP-forming)/AMP-acid ligase II